MSDLAEARKIATKESANSPHAWRIHSNPLPPQNRNNSQQCEEILMLKVVISCDDDHKLHAACDPKTLLCLQTEMSSAIKKHAGHSAIVNIKFYNGSLIAIIAITGVVISGIAAILPYISEDLSNIGRRIFHKVPGINIRTFMKITKETLTMVNDVITIVSKLFSLFGGGLSPLPTNFDPQGWNPI